MADEKTEGGRTVRVTVRISVPSVSMTGAVALEALIAEIVEGMVGATYDLSIGSPRPER